MRRQILALIAAAFAALSLVACDAVPDSGPVREGLANLEQAERGVFINPQGPAKGADPESIIRGFVRAASSNLNDYEIAREFLSPVYADQWDPSSGALVYEGAAQFEGESSNVASLALHVVAAVDAGGTMQLADPETETKVRFELAQVGGEWRIASAPNGIIIDRSNFSSVWETRSLYFSSPDHRLVAEVRWLITDRSSLPSQTVTKITKALIGGPSAAMAGAISTAFPEGTSLVGGTVPIVDGTAVIDVTSEIFDADETAMSAIKRQLAASLQGLPGVVRFQIAVNGTVVGGGDVVTGEDALANEFQRIVILKNGEFGTSAGTALNPIAGMSDQVAALSPTAVTVAPDLSEAVALHPGGISWVAGGQTLALDSRSGLLAPSLDQLGYVWVYSLSEPGEITVINPGTGRLELSPAWLDTLTVKAIRVSTGGNRLAVLVNNDGTSEVRVAGIMRDESGAPIGLTDTATVQLHDLGAPIDIDWIGDNRFVLMSETGLLGGSAKVAVGEVSGRFPIASGSVSGGASISGGGGSRSLLRVLDDQHRLFKPQGSGWQQLMAGVDLIAKVG
jgi:hypothetical protein